MVLATWAFGRGCEGAPPISDGRDFPGSSLNGLFVYYYSIRHPITSAEVSVFFGGGEMGT